MSDSLPTHRLGDLARRLTDVAAEWWLGLTDPMEIPLPDVGDQDDEREPAPVSPIIRRAPRPTDTPA